MDDFSGILARDFGFRPGKSAPMAASKPQAAGSAARPSAGTTSWNKSRSAWNSDSPLGDQGAAVSGSRGSPPAYDDVFHGGGGYSNSAAHGRSASSASPPTDFDTIFDGFKDSAPKPSNSSSPPTSSMPVYDKPVYDDDIFEGVPGLKSTSSVNYDDVFVSMASNRASSPPYEDLLGSLGNPVSGSKGMPAGRSASAKEQKVSDFDDLIPGFGGSSPPDRREPSVSSKDKTVFSSAKPGVTMEEDPFKVFESVSTASTYSSSGLSTDPLEHIGRPVNSGSTKVNAFPVNGRTFDKLPNSMSSFANEANNNKRNQSPQKYTQDMNPGLHSLGREASHQVSSNTFEDILPNMQPSKPSVPQNPVDKIRFRSSDVDDNNVFAYQSPKYHERVETADDIWVTVAEIPIFTQPTNAPPPLRPPPPLTNKQSPANRMDNEFTAQSTQQDSYSGNSVKKSVASPVDELEDFAMGKPQAYVQDRAEFFTNEEEIETNSAAASAAAMKEAMDRAEAKFKHAKEVRERERDARIAKTRESQQQERESYGQNTENNEEQQSLDREREEKEQRRLERLREQELERERERKAVERATREARERAAAEARQRAEREKAESERRERERAAVQRAAAEARQRAAAEARQRVERERAERERSESERVERERAEREKVERDVADARERASAERLRAERMAVERAAAEARKRAAEDARRRAAAAATAAAAQVKQKNSPEEDLESFFGMDARATSAPTQRPTSTDTLFNPQAQTKMSHNTSSVSSSTIRKASSTANIVDDWSSIFGGPPSSGEFQEVEGETEERRRARLERHQRTAERAQKALAEKNERDRQAQMEQAERHRIGETLDFEIKRWAAGKEGNLRALLSTLQYVLWPECGWQPVSLTDLITAAAVKKVYRKATLCIHPDKVQQKGATIQQKYIAEKVFDLLKEAWNKFNSEELF